MTSLQRLSLTQTKPLASPQRTAVSPPPLSCPVNAASLPAKKILSPKESLAVAIPAAAAPANSRLTASRRVDVTSAAAPTTPPPVSTSYPNRTQQTAQTVSQLGYGRDRTVEYKKQQTKIITQNFILMLVTIALGVFYLLVVFPWLVQKSGQINSKKYVHTEITYQPQTPLFNAPSSDTSQARLSLTGYGTPDSHVQFIINGEARPEYALRIGVNGEFSLVVNLEEGANTIQAYSYDDAGLESGLTKVYTVTLDRSTPKIDLETPVSSQEFTGRAQQTITVSGNTEPNAKILINAVAGIADQDGHFAVNYLLNEGSNLLQISATDKANNQDKVLITVSYAP